MSMPGSSSWSGAHKRLCNRRHTADVPINHIENTCFMTIGKYLRLLMVQESQAHSSVLERHEHLRTAIAHVRA